MLPDHILDAKHPKLTDDRPAQEQTETVTPVQQAFAAFQTGNPTQPKALFDLAVTEIAKIVTSAVENPHDDHVIAQDLPALDEMIASGEQQTAIAVKEHVRNTGLKKRDPRHRLLSSKLPKTMKAGVN